MCNLYRMTKATAEVARLLIVPLGQIGNAGGEVYPGYPGLVVAGGGLHSMVWGFPRVLNGAKGHPLKPKPVNNTRADKLDSFMWRTASKSGNQPQMDDWARIADDAAHCERNSGRPGRFSKLHLGQTGCDVEIIYG